MKRIPLLIRLSHDEVKPFARTKVRTMIEDLLENYPIKLPTEKALGFKKLPKRYLTLSIQVSPACYEWLKQVSQEYRISINHLISLQLQERKDEILLRNRKCISP